MILNLYAGIGGNRKLWGDEHEVTSVENVQHIAEAYAKMYPQDKLVIADAHQYLLEHHKEFDFIWSSPPCPTHSRVSTALSGWGIHRYPDMALYQEILFLKHFFKGSWVVENVIPYYDYLITPTVILDRHYFWASRTIEPAKFNRAYEGAVTEATKEVLAAEYGIELPEGTKDQRKLLRNAVRPDLGLHIFEQVNLKQGALL